MPRYFLEITYRGTNYSGFQTQKNANTIQGEVEKAILIILKENSTLTGSSRTDSGVHALQNFFHFNFENDIHPHFLYKINAILPADIAVKKIIPVSPDAHCRFDAISREYRYYIYSRKNPFLRDRAYYYPYKLDIGKLQSAAEIILQYNDFTSFSKRNTQVKTFLCTIQESKWFYENDCLVYNVRGNRFLRGMVRAITSTMLSVGREKMDLHKFRTIIEARDCTQASFAIPPHGLFLTSVRFPYLD